VKNDWARLAILLSVLFLLAFPFAGLAPLTLLLFVALCGWVFQLFTTVMTATESTGTDSTRSEVVQK
jgi:hypothetical protein